MSWHSKRMGSRATSRRGTRASSARRSRRCSRAARAGASGGSGYAAWSGGRTDWYGHALLFLVRCSDGLQARDDLEDEELAANQLTEAMPTAMAGCKDHPLYVLARHLKRDEVVEPAVELGKLRGEPVYPRGNVLALKTAENWMRQGRTVVVGAQPLRAANIVARYKERRTNKPLLLFGEGVEIESGAKSQAKMPWEGDVLLNFDALVSR